MDYRNIEYTVVNKVARLTLNRPQVLNALTPDLLEEADNALGRAEADGDVGAVLLTGAGEGFCSGADLTPSTSRNLPRDAKGRVDFEKTLERWYAPFICHMHAMPKPVICAVNGVAAGAGCSLALMADITLAARSARFLQAFVNVGLIPDAGGTWILTRNTGTQRAMGMALLGEKISAEQAAAWSMIWQVLDDEALLDAATAMAEKLANGPSIAICRIKQAIYAASQNDLSSQLMLEGELQHECGHSQDFVEGATAFMEKRKPNFKGK